MQTPLARRSRSLLTLSLLLIACGTDGFDGLNAAVRVTPEAAGANCPDGGTRVDTGTDKDTSGGLDSGEIETTTFVCNGATGGGGEAGAVGLVSVSDEPPGAACQAGGLRVDVGVDDDRDGQLAGGEIDLTTTVCDGVAGATGATGFAGDDGATPLVRLTQIEPGDACAHGGALFEAGLDANADGVLGEGEVTSSTTLCAVAGPPGNDGGPAPPLIEAGADVELSSPTSEAPVQLSGSATALDGALVVETRWIQIAGPAALLGTPVAAHGEADVSHPVDVTLPYPAGCSTTLTFRFEATDSNGTRASDDVEVVLAPAMIWHRGTTTGYEPGAGLAFGPGGRWWTTDSEGGVVAWDGLKRRVYDARDGLPEGRAWSALTVDTEGDVWLVADTSGPPRVVRFDPAGSQATVFCSASEAAEPGCDQVAAALSAGAVCSGALVDGAGGAGAPWILCTGQHLRWNGADFDAFEAVGSLRALGATTSDGRVWLGYTGVDVGIVRVYDPGSGEVTTVQLPDVGYDFGVSGLSARGDRLFVGIVAAPEVVGSGGAVLVHDVIMGTWTAKPLDGTVALAAGVGPTGTLWATDGTTLRGRAADALEWSSAPAAIGAPGLAAGARVTPAGSLLIGALELCE